MDLPKRAIPRLNRLYCLVSWWIMTFDIQRTPIIILLQRIKIIIIISLNNYRISIQWLELTICSTYKVACNFWFGLSACTIHWPDVLQKGCQSNVMLLFSLLSLFLPEGFVLGPWNFACDLNSQKNKNYGFMGFWGPPLPPGAAF